MILGLLILLQTATPTAVKGEYFNLEGERRFFFEEVRAWASEHGKDYVAGRTKAPRAIEDWVWSEAGERQESTPIEQPSVELGLVVDAGRSLAHPNKPVEPLAGSWATVEAEPASHPKRERVQRNLDRWGHTQSLYRVKTKGQNAEFWATKRRGRLAADGYQGLFPGRKGPLPKPPDRKPDGTTWSKYAVRPYQAGD